MKSSPISLEKNTNLKQINIQEGHQFKVKCRAVGDPTPKIDWFFNEKKIDENKFEDINIKINEKMSMLYINKVNVKHAGNYSCMAHNDNGLLRKWIIVSVMKNYMTTRRTTTTNTENTLSIKCNPDNCLYGKCTHQNETVYCKCISSYIGERCDKVIERTNVSESCLTFQNNKDPIFSDHKVFALIGFGFSIILVLMLFGLWCLYKFRTKRRPYILGEKIKRSSDKGIQVSDFFDYDIKIPLPILENFPNGNIDYSKQTHTIYSPNIPSIYNLSSMSPIACCSPSGQSLSLEGSQINQKIINSINNLQYPVISNPVSEKSVSPSFLQQHMIQLETSLPYICSPLEMSEKINFDNYISKLIPISFPCTDPSCCLSIGHTMPVTSNIKDSYYSNKNVISLHSNPLINNPQCNCKCNIRKVNTFV